MKKASVLVTGASGFIGSHLLPFLLARDYQVIALTRQKNKVPNHPSLTWINDFSELKIQHLDYVINLAGENIGQAHWTAKRKQQLIASRVETTTQLFAYLKRQQIVPKCIISGSAVGYYGIDDTEQWSECCTEQSLPQAIFMSELCQQWEQAALADNTQNTKIIRLGVVFGRGGGILPQMLLPIKLNAVGKIGHGRQPLVWVHIDDVLHAIEFLLTHETQAQVFNVVAPEKMNQAQFAREASKKLKRRPFLPAPQCLFKLMLGEQSQLILNGQYVQPKALMDAGFRFRYPSLNEALRDLLP